MLEKALCARELLTLSYKLHRRKSFRGFYPLEFHVLLTFAHWFCPRRFLHDIPFLLSCLPHVHRGVKNHINSHSIPLFTLETRNEEKHRKSETRIADSLRQPFLSFHPFLLSIVFDYVLDSKVILCSRITRVLSLDCDSPKHKRQNGFPFWSEQIVQE